MGSPFQNEFVHTNSTAARMIFISCCDSRVIVQAAPRAPTADVGCERRLVEVRERMQASLALSHLTVHSLDPTGLASIGPHTRGSGTVELSSFNA
jgi:hypothetical protein